MSTFSARTGGEKVKSCEAGGQFKMPANRKGKLDHAGWKTQATAKQQPGKTDLVREPSGAPVPPQIRLR
jgi:hypothetical protein